MREQAVAAKDLVFAADRIETQRRHAVEQRLARLHVVDVRRRHALHPDMRRARVVHLGAEPGMRLELRAVGKIHDVRVMS